jgi:hypothetical protein
MSAVQDLAVEASPLYEHNCSRCVYLGQYKLTAVERADLYVCASPRSPSVIARYSSSGPDYTSGMEASYGNTLALTEARRRAEARGLLEFNVYQALDYAVKGSVSYGQMYAQLPFTEEYQAWLAHQTGNQDRARGLVVHLMQLSKAKPYLKKWSDTQHLENLESRIKNVILAATDCKDFTAFTRAAELTSFLWEAHVTSEKCTWIDLTHPDIQKAREFALVWHAGQMWGALPYIEHLDEVAELLASRGAEVWQIVAAYLHDIIEDPKCPELEILSRFGCLVLHWVLMVTGVGTNRKEKQLDIVNKLRKDTTRAALLKLVDRVVNVRKCVREGNLKLLKMYRKDAELYGELFAAVDPELAAELNRLLEN